MGKKVKPKRVRDMPELFLPHVTPSSEIGFCTSGHLYETVQQLVASQQVDRVEDLMDLALAVGLIHGKRQKLKDHVVVLQTPAVLPNHQTYGLILAEVVGTGVDDEEIHKAMEETAAGGLQLICDNFIEVKKVPGDGVIDSDVCGGRFESGRKVTLLKLDMLLEFVQK